MPIIKGNNCISIAGVCVNHDGIFKATIHISSRTGLITGISPYSTNADIVVTDCFIFPGVIDLHVHGREDESGDDNGKEDFFTLGEAAINGGVVHVGDMPNNTIPPIDDERYERKQLLTKKSRIPVTLYAATGPNTSPLQKVVPYKFFLARSTGKNDLIFFKNADEVLAATARYPYLDASYHCEHQERLNEKAQELTHELRRPPTAELEGIDLAVQCIEENSQSGKLCHCSVLNGIRKVQAAKTRGVELMIEVTPHHLYFDTDMLNDGNRAMLQMNPPLRSYEDRIGLIEMLRNETIDVIASDHAPHDKLKDKGIGIPLSEKPPRASGLPLLDTIGPFLTWLMSNHKFQPQDIARVACYNPAKFINKFHHLHPELEAGKGYGKIEEGYIGSLTIIDPYTPITIHRSMLKTKCGWSPFEGHTFPGSVRHTIVRGQVLK